MSGILKSRKDPIENSEHFDQSQLCFTIPCHSTARATRATRAHHRGRGCLLLLAAAAGGGACTGGGCPCPSARRRIRLASTTCCSKRTCCYNHIPCRHYQRGRRSIVPRTCRGDIPHLHRLPLLEHTCMWHSYRLGRLNPRPWKRQGCSSGSPPRWHHPLKCTCSGLLEIPSRSQ